MDKKEGCAFCFDCDNYIVIGKTADIINTLHERIAELEEQLYRLTAPVTMDAQFTIRTDLANGISLKDALEAFLARRKQQ